MFGKKPKLARQTQQQLRVLEDFKMHVWGGGDTLTKHIPRGARQIEYLDLDNHLEAAAILCYSLRKTKIMVTQEYRDAMNKFKSDDAYYRNGAVILGQPGIGKSFFVIYAVVESLRARQPVAVEVFIEELDHHAYALFSEGKTTIHTSGHLEALKNHVPPLWIFSDSTVVTPTPSYAFLATPGIRIFQTTSPSVSHWMSWSSDYDIGVYIMDVWTLDEIVDLGFVMGYNDTTRTNMQTNVQRYGPVPRTVLSVQRPENKNIVDGIINNQVLKAVEHPTTLISILLDIDTIVADKSSTLFFVRPLRHENAVFRHIHTVSIPTTYLMQKIYRALQCHMAMEKVKFFNLLSSSFRTRSAAGCIFEEFVHDLWVSGKAITITWYGQPDHTETIEVPAVQTVIDDLKSQAPFYWRPSDPSYPGIDSAIITRDHVYVIQATIGRHRKPREKVQQGIDRLWQKMPNDKKGLEWKLVFVGPVEKQILEASADCVAGMQVGDVWTRGRERQGGFPRGELAVGRLVLFPEIQGPFQWSLEEDPTGPN